MAGHITGATPYRFVIGLVAAVIIILGIFLAILFILQPAANTLWYEAAKMCLQVAGVILFGALVTLATFLFQKEWEQRREKLKKESDNKREDLRRESDNLRDERKRQDELLRSMLNQTLGAYNGVKRIRRILKSQSGDGMISKEVYEQSLIDLNDHQLVFEDLARSVGALDDKRLRRGLCPDLKADYDGIESYLNESIKEFEKNLHSVKTQGRVTLTDLEKLNLFVTKTKDFRTGMSNRFNRIELTLQKALLVPLVLPFVGDNGQQAPPVTGQGT